MVINISLDITTAEVRDTFISNDGSKLLAEFVQHHDNRSSIKPRLWSCALTNPNDPPEHAVFHRAPHLANLADRISRTVGLLGSTLIFLDPSSWVCSVDLSAAVADNIYMRHFFVPYDWFSSTRELVCAVTAKRDVVFVRVGEIAIVKRGLEDGECVRLVDGSCRDCGRRRVGDAV